MFVLSLPICFIDCLFHSHDYTNPKIGNNTMSQNNNIAFDLSALKFLQCISYNFFRVWNRLEANNNAIFNNQNSFFYCVRFIYFTRQINYKSMYCL